MIKIHNNWAEEQFGHAKLGELRRAARLVKVASDLAQHPGKSVLKSLLQPAWKVCIVLFGTIIFHQTILLKLVFMQHPIKSPLPSLSRYRRYNHLKLQTSLYSC